jgi:pseudaminic acid synthase
VKKYLSFRNKKVGPGNPVFIVAEMSGNHNQKLERAMAIVDAAVSAGVDAIKMQTYTPDTMTIDCDNKYFQIKVNESWKGQTLYSLYKKAFTPWEWQAKIKSYAESKGLVAFSTPFDESSVNFLEKLNMPLYKVASFEIGDLELLKRIGKTKKPVIISRGLASVEDISLAIRTLNKAGSTSVAVLHCVSSYPATQSQMNIATVPDIARRFGVVSGLSDHSSGITASVAAVALGASIIERHLTLKRSDGGPDAEFSLEPQEMKRLVNTIRRIELAIGKPSYKIGVKEKENVVFKRSLFVVKDIEKGDMFSKNNIRCIRPGYGLEPKNLSKVLGKRAKKNIKRGTPIFWGMVSR